MRKLVLLPLALMLYVSLGNVPSVNAAGDSIEITVQTYFDYLKSGDTEGILSCLTDPLLSERRSLLEKNTAYPDFLRDMYRSAYIVIKNVEEDKGKIEAEIYLNEHDPPLRSRFILKRPSGAWLISEEINE
jgi:hypothetical protein